MPSEKGFVPRIERMVHSREKLAPPLCAFTALKPSEWPRGHIWVEPDMFGVHALDSQQCAECVSLA